MVCSSGCLTDWHGSRDDLDVCINSGSGMTDMSQGFPTVFKEKKKSLQKVLTK